VYLLPQGIMHGLEGTLEKNSPTLNRQAVYTTKSRVARLPKYVMTQLVRFYYKADTQKKCKIMRPIKFPFFLDMHDYCKPDLQAKIKVYREKKLAQQREEEAEAKRAKFSHSEAAAPGEAAAAGTQLLACLHVTPPPPASPASSRSFFSLSSFVPRSNESLSLSSKCL